MPIFSNADSLGSRDHGNIAAYLTEIGDLAGAKLYTDSAAGGQMLGLPKQPWEHTGFAIGYIAPAGARPAGAAAIVGAAEIDGDRTMIGQRIKVTLDKFYVRSYPGLGRHRILCEFAGKNQAIGAVEELRFARRFEVDDKASAAQMGVPIFLGLTVGRDGISFEGRTVNVRSTTDERLLSALDSPTFQAGLTLIEAVQPAIKPFTSLATAAVEAALARSKNAQVHNFNLGLDFSNNQTSARLRKGSYVVVQKDNLQGWRWDDWQWNAGGQVLQLRAGPARDIEFNYLVIGVADAAPAVGP